MTDQHEEISLYDLLTNPPTVVFEPPVGGYKNTLTCFYSAEEGRKFVAAMAFGWAAPRLTVLTVLEWMAIVVSPDVSEVSIWKYCEDGTIDNAKIKTADIREGIRQGIHLIDRAHGRKGTNYGTN